MKRGQLTLELILLLLGVVVGGTVVATQISNPNIGSGSEVKEFKNISMVAFSSPVPITTTDNNQNDVQIRSHTVYAKNININSTSSERNNELTIYDINGHIYKLYKKENRKGLIDKNDGNIIYIGEGESFSGKATKIIFRWKRGNSITLLIDGTNRTLKCKKVTLIANNIENPIKYTISHESGSGNFYLSFNATNATVIVE
ncbi:class III signal peptide-containing protein [Methanotorris igneus]|nr:class III signal peptide-containing protein [Methanotorris igneus]